MRLPNFFRSLSNFCTNLCHLKTNHIFINYIYILVIDSVPPVLFCFSRVVLICMHEKMFVFVCLLFFLSTKKNNSYSPLKTAFYLTRPVFFCLNCCHIRSTSNVSYIFKLRKHKTFLPNVVFHANYYYFIIFSIVTTQIMRN